MAGQFRPRPECSVRRINGPFSLIRIVGIRLRKRDRLVVESLLDAGLREVRRKVNLVRHRGHLDSEAALDLLEHRLVHRVHDEAAGYSKQKDQGSPKLTERSQNTTSRLNRSH